MFVKDAAKPLVSVVAGVQRKTLAVGEHTLMSKFVLEAGSELPLHKHLHEQIGFLVSGKLILTIGEESCSMEPGDSWAVPGGVRKCWNGPKLSKFFIRCGRTICRNFDVAPFSAIK